MESLDSSGDPYLTHATVDGRVLRMAIGGPATEPHHLHEAWRRIREERGLLMT